MTAAELLVAAMAALSVLLILYVVLAAPSRTQARLGDLGPGQVQNLEELELEAPIFERTIRPLVNRIGRLSGRVQNAAFEDRSAKRLALAGYPFGLTVSDWLAAKVLVGIVFGLGLLFLFILIGAPIASAVLFGVLGIGVGFLVPDFWLGQRIRTRHQLILESLPDSIDLLTISVRAGLGFDAALAKVAEEVAGPLSDEFRRALAEIRVGKERRDALRDVVARTQVQPVTNLIGAILQAERLGVPISRVLQVQSETLRVERRQRAEEMASKAPIKILFPLVGCIFPSLFIVILGPAVILIIKNF